MQIHDISAYETSAESFFQKLAGWNVDLVLDIRLHNTSQLSGFTKNNDLAYFVKTILHADYVHDTLFSPEAEVLSPYLAGKLPWEEFAADYRATMAERDALSHFLSLYGEYESIALVGTATHKRRSHAEVLREMIGSDARMRGQS